MTAGNPLPASSIKDQLNRILLSSTFKNSTILSGFLQYITDETLAGREKELKEYTIGVHALYRNSDFNPQLDAIVRIHAGRLRRALKEYYHETGKQDPLIIEIPKGSYIPVFQLPMSPEQKDATEKPIQRRNKPVVAVLPFRNISKDSSRDFFADGLGEQLSTDLTRFSELSVISYYSSRNADAKTTDVKQAAILLGAKYILTGSIQTDSKHLRVSVQLVLCDNGEQLWSKSFDRKNSGSGLFEIQNEIVRNILFAIGGYYGEIFKDAMNTRAGGQLDNIEFYNAAFWYYHFQKVYSREVLQNTISALESAVKADPTYALAWAMLAELYLDDKALDVKKIENPLELAMSCAQKAVHLDPSCQHAYLSLAWVNLFYKNKAEVLRATDKCIALNPNSADKTGALGFVAVCAGEFEKGYSLLNSSIEHNPFCPWWFYVAYCFYFLQKKDYEKAWMYAEKIQTPDLFWDPFLKSVVLGLLNRIPEAKIQKNLLLKLMPDAETKVEPVIESFLLSSQLVSDIMDGFYKSGHFEIVAPELKKAASSILN